ncbi:MAG: hypothetical protein R3288_06560 [Woeseiaceae bacterium]|nr:hypothetical protein [Woeseiaceae bacterium]
MLGRRNPFIAREGIPLVLGAGVLCWYASRYLEFPWFVAAALLFVVLLLIFRDPRRRIPAIPLGVVSPVDGRVLKIDVATTAVLHGKARRVLIRVNAFGTYTARSPVEGKVMDLNSIADELKVGYPTNALWMQTDEGDDIVLQFGHYRFGLPPKSLTRYGERLGQGTRCAYLRLTRLAEVHLPFEAKITVEPGQRLVAGRDVIARLPPP